jgi:hypothetical protein
MRTSLPCPNNRRVIMPPTILVVPATRIIPTLLPPPPAWEGHPFARRHDTDYASPLRGNERLFTGACRMAYLGRPYPRSCMNPDRWDSQGAFARSLPCCPAQDIGAASKDSPWRPSPETRCWLMAIRGWRLGGWVAEMGGCAAGRAQPLESSAPDFKNTSLHRLPS